VIVAADVIHASPGLDPLTPWGEILETLLAT
jgi:hypothetical protein